MLYVVYLIIVEVIMFFVPIPRSIAKERGIKHYFTGLPCSSFNGINRRLVSNGTCLCEDCRSLRKSKKRTDAKLNRIARKETTDKWRKENRERINQKSLEWYHLNKKDVNERRSKKYKTESYRLSQRLYYKVNRVKILKRDLKYKSRTVDLKRNYDSAYYLKNRSKILKKVAEYRKANQTKITALAAQREYLKQSATLIDKELTYFVYLQSRALSTLRKKLLGFDWHTDHMIPLQNPIVCGLHVWNNFQCIPKIMNQTKSNKLIYTNPHEWLYDIPKFFKIVYQKDVV